MPAMIFFAEPPVDPDTPVELLPKNDAGEPITRFISFLYFVLEAC